MHERVRSFRWTRRVSKGNILQGVFSSYCGLMIIVVYKIMTTLHISRLNVNIINVYFKVVRHATSLPFVTVDAICPRILGKLPFGFNQQDALDLFDAFFKFCYL